MINVLVNKRHANHVSCSLWQIYTRAKGLNVSGTKFPIPQITLRNWETFSISISSNYSYHTYWRGPRGFPTLSMRTVTGNRNWMFPPHGAMHWTFSPIWEVKMWVLKYPSSWQSLKLENRAIFYKIRPEYWHLIAVITWNGDGKRFLPHQKRRTPCTFIFLFLPPRIFW